MSVCLTASIMGLTALVAGVASAVGFGMSWRLLIEQVAAGVGTVLFLDAARASYRRRWFRAATGTLMGSALFGGFVWSVAT
jgi:hypothetical protein